MSNEIKEIKINKEAKSITFINNGIAFSQFGIANEILDLITNLQEENKDLKYSNIYLSKTCDRYKITVENYKSRCEKAIEYIENDMPYLEEPSDDYENDHKMIEYNGDILLNILTGGDKE